MRADASGDRDATTLAGPVPRRRGGPRAGGGLVGAEGPHPAAVPGGVPGGEGRGRRRGDGEGPAGPRARGGAAAGAGGGTIPPRRRREGDGPARRRSRGLAGGPPRVPVRPPRRHDARPRRPRPRPPRRCRALSQGGPRRRVADREGGARGPAEPLQGPEPPGGGPPPRPRRLGDLPRSHRHPPAALEARHPQPRPPGRTPVRRRERREERAGRRPRLARPGQPGGPDESLRGGR